MIVRGTGNRLRTTVFLALLGLCLAYTVFNSAGADRESWTWSTLAIGCCAIVFWISRPEHSNIPALHPVIRRCTLALICYVAFQIIPLPSSALTILSPERARLLAGLAPIAPGLNHASLSVTPAQTLLYLIRTCAYTAVFLIIRELTYALRVRWLAIMPILSIAIIQAFIAIGQQSAGMPVTGTYLNRNHLAGLIEMSIPFAILMPVALIRFAGFRPAARYALAAVLFVVPVILSLTLGYSASRAGYVSCAVSLAVCTLLAIKGVRHGLLIGAAISAALVITFAALAPENLMGRFEGLFSEEQMGDRPLIWRESLDLVRAYPLFGCGFGGYEFAFRKFQVSRQDFVYDFAHNDYIQFLAELGIIGVSIVAVAIIFIVTRAVRKCTLNAPDGVLAIAATGAVSAILFHSFSDFNLYIPANAIVLAWILGIAEAICTDWVPLPNHQRAHHGDKRDNRTSSSQIVPCS